MSGWRTAMELTNSRLPTSCQSNSHAVRLGGRQCCDSENRRVRWAGAGPARWPHPGMLCNKHAYYRLLLES